MLVDKLLPLIVARKANVSEDLFLSVSIQGARARVFLSTTLNHPSYIRVTIILYRLRCSDGSWCAVGELRHARIHCSIMRCHIGEKRGRRIESRLGEKKEISPVEGAS